MLLSRPKQAQQIPYPRSTFIDVHLSINNPAPQDHLFAIKSPSGELSAHPSHEIKIPRTASKAANVPKLQGHSIRIGSTLERPYCVIFGAHALFIIMFISGVSSPIILCFGRVYRSPRAFFGVRSFARTFGEDIRVLGSHIMHARLTPNISSLIYVPFALVSSRVRVQIVRPGINQLFIFYTRCTLRLESQTAGFGVFGCHPSSFTS